jgi:hypothetical protein
MQIYRISYVSPPLMRFGLLVVQSCPCLFLKTLTLVKTFALAPAPPALL